MGDVREFLEAMRDLTVKAAANWGHSEQEGFLYQTYEDLLLTEGQEWKGAEARVEILGPMKNCYGNAGTAALSRDGWSYVEGYATSFMPIHHAWCLDQDGVVVETTWPEPAEEYLGIIIPLPRLRQSLLETGYTGVMPSDYLNQHRLLKEGIKGEL